MDAKKSKTIILLGEGELHRTVETEIRKYFGRGEPSNFRGKLISHNNDFDVNEQGIEADLIISAGYGKRIIKPLENNIPCFNIHLSPLPKYAGFNPFYWAIKNDEREWGITLHEIVFEFDAGGIICQIMFPISEGDTARSLYDRALHHAKIMVQENLEGLVNGDYETTRQDLTKRTFYKKSSVDYDETIMFDGSQEMWREIRARYFPPFPLPRINLKEKS